MREVVPFIDEKTWLSERSKDITSTEVSALFGLNPYLTLPELFYLKSGKLENPFQDTDRTTWGRRLQGAIADGIATDNGWQIREMKEYIRDPTIRAGASFDYETKDGAILEIKNVDGAVVRDTWIIEGDEIQCSAHVEMQVQQQLWLSEKKCAYIGALVNGNKVLLVRREPDEQVIEAIKNKISQFWFAVGAGIEPVLDPAKDAELICRLFQYAEVGKVLNMQHDDRITELAAHHKQLGETIKQLEAERESVKAQLLMSIGDAEKVLCNGFTITAGLVGPTPVSYERSGYRNFRLNWPRGKKGTT